MKYINVLILGSMLLIMFGCASFDNTYMGNREFVTMEECNIAMRLKEITPERHYLCVVDRLPETLW